MVGGGGVGGGGGYQVHDTRYTLLTSVLRLSLPFSAVSFGLESHPWVSLNNENNDGRPTTAPLPFSLFLSNRMLWIRHHSRIEGHGGYLSSPENMTLVHTTMWARRGTNFEQTTDWWLLRINVLITGPQTTSPLAMFVLHFCFFVLLSLYFGSLSCWSYFKNFQFSQTE